jgi:hypothetical protein
LLRLYYQPVSVAHVIPGPDGRTIYTSRVLYTEELKPTVAEQENAVHPAVHGNLYLSLSGPNPPGGGPDRSPPVTIHLAGDARPLITLKDLPGLEMPADPFRAAGINPIEKRLFLIPQGKLIVTIPDTGTGCTCSASTSTRPWRSRGSITSQPPRRFQPGSPLSYTLESKSKKGGVKCKLDAGPEGMKVTPDGKLTWNVPATFAGNEVDVILTVSDASGQEVFHTFRIVIQ